MEAEMATHKSNINPRALPEYDREVLLLLREILSRVKAIEGLLPDPRGLCRYPDQQD
jgi:hypothetical protein